MNDTLSNKVSCDVIKDLLPLYVDDVCSEASRQLLEEHLAGCEACQAYYESLTEDLPPIVLAEDCRTSSVTSEIAILKKIKKKITTEKILVAAGVFTAFLIVAAFLSSLGYNSGQDALPFFDQRLNAEDIEISELYELEDGRIFFTLTSDEPISWSFQTVLKYDKDLGTDTDYYATASLTNSWWTEHFSNRNGSVRSISFVYPLAVPRLDASDSSALCSISSIIYEGKHDKRLTIWKKGQEIQPAPEHIEQKVLIQSPDEEDVRYSGFSIYNY